MRNPRRIVLSDEVIANYNLSPLSPPTNSLFWQLWLSAGSSSAASALYSPFVQGIAKGTLDPVVYGGFNVNDAYYCFEGAPDYLAASKRAVDEGLQQFLMQKYLSYETYNATFPQIWRVKDPTSIVPFPVCVEYAAFEATIAQKYDPIYCLIVMLPCEFLWAWLALELAINYQQGPQNLYSSWVTDNTGFDGAFAMGMYLDFYQNEYPNAIDPRTAEGIYGQAMMYELKNFLAATDTPMPPPQVPGETAEPQGTTSAVNPQRPVRPPGVP